MGWVVRLEHELSQEGVLEVLFGIFGVVNTGKFCDVRGELVKSHGQVIWDIVGLTGW